MKPLQLRKEVDENVLVHTLVAVHRVRKISVDQLHDILSIKPNHLPSVLERVNLFLKKLAHLVKMYKLQDACNNEKYAKQHPEKVEEVEKYFAKDELFSDKCGEDVVSLGCMYEAIGKFCMSTEKFTKEIKWTPGDTRSEVLRNIIDTIDDDMEERERDSLDVNRYAFWFFNKLLDTQKWLLPKWVSVSDMKAYIKMYVYDDEKNR